MRILIVGGNGFIGRHVARAAQAAGHSVVLGVRAPTALYAKGHAKGYAKDHAKGMRLTPQEIICDMQSHDDTSRWLKRVDTVDAVINCVGLLRDSAQALQAVHCDAPAALAGACSEAKKIFLHISVLGLDHAADIPYFNSKRDGEIAVRNAYPGAIIVRPSLVFGSDSPATACSTMTRG